MSCVDCGADVIGKSKRCEPCKKARALAATRAYREARPGAMAEYMRKRYEERREDVLAMNRAWRAANPDKVKQISAKYRAARADELAAMQRRRRREKPDEMRRLNAQQYARNPEATKQGARRRVYRKMTGRLSKGLGAKLFEQQKGLCACCGASLEQGYHLDHIWPLALGGTNTDDNIQLLTPTCNKRKNALPMDEYMKRRAEYGQAANG